jgi:S-formylglutathione hydrolase FrmB
VDPRDVVLNDPPPGVAPRRPALRVNVLAPERVDPKRGHAVLYLLHGRSDAFDHWSHPAAGAVGDLVVGLDAFVVMPEGARGWYCDWWNGGRRGDPAWERHHLDELLPLVERRLPLRAGRRWRTIAGLSMGGLGALTYAARRPDYFGTAISFSGALSPLRADWPELFNTETEDYRTVYGDEPFYREAHDPATLLHNLRATRLYATAGDGVLMEGDEETDARNPATERVVRAHAEDFAAAAHAAGVDLDWTPTAGSHEWPTWRRALAAARDWDLFGSVPDAAGEWVYRTVARRGTAWNLGFEFDEPPERVQRFERTASALRGLGSGRVTLSGAVEGRHVLPFELPV